jgi:hypothetical protein
MSDEEQRYAAFAAVEEARQSGDQSALGWALIRLSQLARQIGLGSDDAPFVEAARVGGEAVAIFRGLDDARGLATALRMAAVPSVGVDDKAMLEESLQVAIAAGDREQEAWARLQFGRTQRNVEEIGRARELFLSLDHKVGSGFAIQSYAMQASIPRSQKAVLLEQAADLLLEGGRQEDAHRALIIAETFGSPDIGTDEQIRLLERAAEVAGEPRQRALAYRCLTRVAEEVGRPVEADAYRAKEDALDVEIYGSRAKRLKHDIDIYTEVLELASREEKKDLKAKISTLRKEFNTLSEG